MMKRLLQWQDAMAELGHQADVANWKRPEWKVSE